MKRQAKPVRVAVGYVRRIAAGPEETRQISAIVRAAKARRLELQSTHRDDAGPRQEGLEQAIQQACRSRGVLVVQSLAVLTRSALGCMRISERLCRGRADLIVAAEKIDTTASHGRAFFEVLGMLARLDVERCRLDQRPPYGFDLADDGEHLVISPQEQAVIRRVIAFHRDGWSHARIAAQLNKEGVRARGGSWEAESVNDIIDHAPTSRWALLDEES